MKEEQNGQHGLVDVAVADALIEEEAGVSNHRLQGVLPHDVVQLVCVEVLVHQLVPELPEVADAGAGGAAEQASSAVDRPRPTRAASKHGVIGQVQAAAAAVQADRGAALLVRHLGTGG